MDIDILLGLQDFRNGAGSCLADFLSKMTYFGEVNYSATSNRASCFNHYCVGYDIHNSASYTVSTGV